MLSVVPRRAKLNWTDWLVRWDRQQTAYMPFRERRFELMFDVLEALLPGDFIAVDLACGPGSLSQRLLARFPHARTVAVDLDPVLMTLGRKALRRLNDRITWVEADLRDPRWVRRLPQQRFDAVLSTTALHWLKLEELRRLYRSLRGIVRPRGVVLNGDLMSFGPHRPTFDRLSRTVDRRRMAKQLAAPGMEDWTTWWSRLARAPGLGELFAERRRRFPREHHSEQVIPIGAHEAALRAAGFREVGGIWQDLDNRVLMAVR